MQCRADLPGPARVLRAAAASAADGAAAVAAAALAEAHAITAEDLAMCHAIGAHGAPLIPDGLDATVVLLRHGESEWIREGRFLIGNNRGHLNGWIGPQI